MTLLKTFRLRKLKLSIYLKNILISNQKIFGAKILINNKGLKVLVTEGTKLKIIAKFLTKKNTQLCARDSCNSSNEMSLDTD